MKNRKTKPENPGLEGRLNTVSGLKKFPLFGFGQTRVANHIFTALIQLLTLSSPI